MEQVGQILHTLSEIGFSPLNIVLLVMLYLVLAEQGVVPKLWNKNGEQETKMPPWAQTLHENQNKLAQYANHDTTKHHEMTHTKLDELKESAVEQTHLLREMLKYGIKCRIDKE